MNTQLANSLAEAVSALSLEDFQAFLKPGVPHPAGSKLHPKSLSPRERDFEGFSGSPRPLGEGLGVRGRTTVLNMDLV
jgi:hypothetical protein